MKEVHILAPKNKSWVFDENLNQWQEVTLKYVNIQPENPVIEIDENEEALKTLEIKKEQAKNDVATAILELKQKREVLDSACYLGTDLTKYLADEKEKIQTIMFQLDEKIAEYSIKKDIYETIKEEYNCALLSKVNAGSI